MPERKWIQRNKNWIPASEHSAIVRLAGEGTAGSLRHRVTHARRSTMPQTTAPTEKANKYTLPPLPYAYAAPEPYIAAQTMQIHHGKHHQAYVNNLNAALDKHPALYEKSLEALLRGITSVPED